VVESLAPNASLTAIARRHEIGTDIKVRGFPDTWAPRYQEWFACGGEQAL